MKTEETLLELSEETSTNKKELNSTITNQEEIPGSPFTLVKVDKMYFLALGKYRLTNLTENKEELIELVKQKHWDILLATISAILTELNNK